MNDRILLVDDEKDILDLIEEVLRAEGLCQCRRAVSGREAVSLAKVFQPDVIVLDVMLPDMDGVEVCRQIRAFSRCSVIFVSAKGEDVDKIVGLAAGGDDYVAKPFSPKELVYRVKAQLRRQCYMRGDAGSEKEQCLTVGGLRLDPSACAVERDGHRLDLTAKEYRLLQFLMENPGRIVSKERLYETVWGEVSAVCDNTIMVHIRHLREKIEDDPSRPRYLLTVKGLGYKLTEGVNP